MEVYGGETTTATATVTTTTITATTQEVSTVYWLLTAGWFFGWNCVFVSSAFLYSQTSIGAGGSAHFLIRLFCLRDLPKVYDKSALQAFETKCKFEMYTSTNAAGCGQNIGVGVYTSTHTTGYGLNLFLHFFQYFGIFKLPLTPEALSTFWECYLHVFNTIAIFHSPSSTPKSTTSPTLPPSLHCVC